MNTAHKGSAASVELQGHKAAMTAVKRTQRKSLHELALPPVLQSTGLQGTWLQHHKNRISKLIENFQVNLIHVKNTLVHIWISNYIFLFC